MSRCIPEFTLYVLNEFRTVGERPIIRKVSLDKTLAWSHKNPYTSSRYFHLNEVGKCGRNIFYFGQFSLYSFQCYTEHHSGCPPNLRISFWRQRTIARWSWKSFVPLAVIFDTHQLHIQAYCIRRAATTLGQLTWEGKRAFNKKNQIQSLLDCAKKTESRVDKWKRSPVSGWNIYLVVLEEFLSHQVTCFLPAQRKKLKERDWSLDQLTGLKGFSKSSACIHVVSRAVFRP